MKPLGSNRELYDYLVRLAMVLRSRGCSGLGDIVSLASRNAVDMNTVFLGESRIALRQVLQEENGVLTDEERAQLVGILAQLDHALSSHH